MRIAVLFDGAGLARQGLELAGHICTGVELDPHKHYLSSFVGSGSCVLADVRSFDLAGFDAVWASPPCQQRSQARTQGAPKSAYAEDLVDWALGLDVPILWVENVLVFGDQFGTVYNAAQFHEPPLQIRNRVIGGRHLPPAVLRSYARALKGVCPAITATEYRGCASDRRRASRFYGRVLTLTECAYHQGFSIPKEWAIPPPWFAGTAIAWRNQQYEAIGNGVPVYMAQAFGKAYK